MHLDYTFSQGAILLALASDKRIGDLHAFSVDSDCIHFGPGDCGVTFWPRITCLKSLSTPFRTQTVSLSALSSESSTSRDANAQISCAPSGLWGFTSTVRPAFGNLTSYLVCYGGCAKGRIKTEASHWIVDAIKAAYTSQGWNAPFTLGSTQQGLSPSVRGWEVCLFRIYTLQPAGLLRIPLPGFTSWTVSPLPRKCCRWVTDSRLCYLYSCVFAASHSITLYSLLCYCCCGLPCTQCSPSYTMYILLVYHHVLFTAA